MNRGPKSSLQLYRDCMRLVKHLAGTTVRNPQSHEAKAASCRRSSREPSSRTGGRDARTAGRQAKLNSLGGPPPARRHHPACVQSQKSSQLRKIVSDQFRANKDVTDPARLHQLKQA